MSVPAIAPGEGIAILGMACRFPGAADLEAFWRNLRDGVDSILDLTEADLEAAGVPAELRRHPDFVRAGTLVPGFDLFAAELFGLSDREAALLDPQQRLFLECAWEALEAAGYAPGALSGLVGVYAGAASNEYAAACLDADPELCRPQGRFEVRLGNDGALLPARVSSLLGLCGPSVNVQSACSSSLLAVHLACEGLLGRQCDVALAGGVSLRLPQKRGYLYQEGGVASPDGRCRAFDARGRGTVFGSGCGVVVLKRLADALAAGDPVAAVVRGSAANNDGGVRVGFAAPGADGQAEVVAAAQAIAGVGPDDISYVEAHGTGTPLGDPIEVEALTRVFRARSGRRGDCPIGSVKTNVGHLETAAGVAGLIKTVLALERRQIPASLHFASPNPAIDFAASPFYVNTRLAPWGTPALPRRAGVSSFGIGGTNVHLIVEEAPAAPPPAAAAGLQLLVLSAATPTALAAQASRLRGHLERHPALALADVAWTLQRGRRALAHRRALLAATPEEAVAGLGREEARPLLGRAGAAAPPPVAFLFPGQGSQHPGMAADLYAQAPSFRRHLDRCAELLLPELGLDLRQLIAPAAERRDEAARQLARTAVAQPVLFALEVGLARLWREWGVEPAAMLGHSLGEYAAACVAEVFSLEQGLALVAARGRLLEQVPPGAMLAVALPAWDVEELLTPDLSLAASSGPQRSLMAGPVAEIEELARRLARDGTACRRLAGGYAFHSPLVEPVVAPLRALFAAIDLQPPKLPYLSNLSGTWIRAAEATDPDYWAAHLRLPVRFAEGARLLARPRHLLLEVGPGRTLGAGLRGGADGAAVLPSLGDRRRDVADLRTLLASLGRLWVEGVEVDWEAVHGGAPRRRVRLPTYPFERRRFWIDPPALAAAPSAREEVHAAAPADEPPVSRRASARPPHPVAAPAPDGRLEQTLRGIWQDVLGLQHVEVDDDFLELGGDSVLALVVAGRARALGLDLTPEQLFRFPTVGRLARALRAPDDRGPRWARPAPPPAAAADPSAPPLGDRAALDRLLRKRGATW